MDRHRDYTESQHIQVIQLAQFMSMFVNLNPNIPEQHRQTKPEDFIPRMRAVEPAKAVAEKKDDGAYRMSLWKIYAEGK